ncbi:MAG: 2Fe-2S iron-sulfur cluster-binding protein, partial [Anaerolineales bacterium]|nr:2Fe-2S iron-sulfur cluster-binding protein [Anaerolineales bacterium]
MPKLTIGGVGEFNVEAGTRLVLALADHGADNMHACGGYGGCTTCRVEFVSGEPQIGRVRSVMFWKRAGNWAGV